jgi:pyruvate/2-oxoglutarate dehydrogenase complex dihydrolipoamide dehydrogenase (E3) component
VRESAQFGTRIQNSTLDWAAVIARQHAIVASLQPTAARLEHAGIRVYQGEARLVGPGTLAVDGREVHGERVLIAAGSAPVIPPFEGRELGLTSDDLLFLPEFPRSLVLVGAGAIGLEMAAAFNDFGSTVTVIGQDSEILPGFDADVAGYLRAILEQRGVTFCVPARVTALAGRRGDVTTRFVDGDTSREVRSAAVCLAVGRRFDPTTLGGEGMPLKRNHLGLMTDSYLRTSVPGVYAAGDAAGNRQLTTTAAYEGRLAAANALQGDNLASDLSIVPQVLFTTPEIAQVGLTHRQARERGAGCQVATHDMRGASNGVATGEEGGYFKLVFEAGTERLLGAQMVSYRAAELIQLIALAIRERTTAGTLASLLSIHPSHGERLIKAAGHDYHDVCEV